MAFKGILDLELGTTKAYPLVLYGNTFTSNSGLIDSNVLNIRVQNSINLLGNSYTSSVDLTCGGIYLGSNTFTSNYGCASTTSTVFAYCFDPTYSQSTSIITNYKSYDA